LASLPCASPHTARPCLGQEEPACAAKQFDVDKDVEESLNDCVGVLAVAGNPTWIGQRKNWQAIGWSLSDKIHSIRSTTAQLPQIALSGLSPSRD
jgi:hypothetical protein